LLNFLRDQSCNGLNLMNNLQKEFSLAVRKNDLNAVKKLAQNSELDLGYIFQNCPYESGPYTFASYAVDLRHFEIANFLYQKKIFLSKEHLTILNCHLHSVCPIHHSP